MKPIRLIIKLLSVLFLFSCASNSDVVRKGLVQKRKYKKGYNLSLRKNIKKQKDSVSLVKQENIINKECNKITTSNKNINNTIKNNKNIIKNNEEPIYASYDNVYKQTVNIIDNNIGVNLEKILKEKEKKTKNNKKKDRIEKNVKISSLVALASIFILFAVESLYKSIYFSDAYVFLAYLFICYLLWNSFLYLNIIKKEREENRIKEDIKPDVFKNIKKNIKNAFFIFLGLMLMLLTTSIFITFVDGMVFLSVLIVFLAYIFWNWFLYKKMKSINLKNRINKGEITNKDIKKINNSRSISKTLGIIAWVCLVLSAISLFLLGGPLGIGILISAILLSISLILFLISNIIIIR